MRFTDIIYGNIDLPDWLVPFLKIPEFVRLRGVRLSNVDSYEFKDLNGPTRWEHCIGVAHLAIRCCSRKNLSQRDSIHLILAALLHDVATPPFAHTIEYVLEGYDHELESSKILGATASDNSNPGFPVFASQLPKFRSLCHKTAKELKIKIDPDEVAEMVTGDNKLGFLINGTIDLDNIDNVTRASLFLGIDIDRRIPYNVVDWLSTFDTVPTDIDSEKNESVQTLLSYKNKMYGKFYNSHEEELGRQAFLQHLIRRAYKEGLSRQSIVWSTDDALLNNIESFSYRYKDTQLKNIFNYKISLNELVQEYRLLNNTYKIFKIPIDDVEDFKLMKNPTFADWLEDELTTTTFEPFVLINSKRYNNQNSLFSKNAGEILVFKLNSEKIKPGQLPDWINKNLSKDVKMSNTLISNIIKEKVQDSVKTKPWLHLTSKRKESIKANLDHVGNWSFRLSRNESIHSYPGTFVHAIPATLITALGLKGELILDPFGGTGQTASEAIKLGCKVITSDSNTIATLISRAKFTFYSKALRKRIVSIEKSHIVDNKQYCNIDFPDIDKWHHKKTLDELKLIKGYIDSLVDEKVKLFYTVCFSDILTACTARKGKEHGYFADNTPLAKGETTPSYENAINHFLNKVKRNCEIIERFYAFIEKNGKIVADELRNVQVKQLDITKVAYSDLNAEPSSISGIITSPPYLCMADYTLGQRLSYYWLFPENFRNDFNNEVGSRRSRTQKKPILDEYFEDMRCFAKTASLLLKENGFLATVIGEPQAIAYSQKKILQKLDKIFSEEGLDFFWDTMRTINWHRNHGYARLKEERIAIYTKS